jgi:hypothetical protein
MLVVQNLTVGYIQMNVKANVAIKVLSILVIVIVTSALVLVLVRTGVVSVKAEHEPVNVLNTEFIPARNVGHLNIREFSFCSFVDDDFNCDVKNSFNFGDEVHFKYIVDSTIFDSQLLVAKNYRIKGPSGELLLDAESKDNFYVDIRSEKKSELISFKDFFTLLGDGDVGVYTIELIIENPLIEKRATLTEKFEVLG